MKINARIDVKEQHLPEKGLETVTEQDKEEEEIKAETFSQHLLKGNTDCDVDKYC